MKIFVETDRLILREMLPEDEAGIFLLDSDPEVHAFLGNKPINNLEQAQKTIQFIRQQYQDNGIARWAVIDRSTNEFLGWSGLKLITQTINNHTNYYDLGYRFIQKYWGEGYATETALATLTYAFDKLNLNEVFAMTDVRNSGSRKVLEKVGFHIILKFYYEGVEHYWFQITKNQWQEKPLTANTNLMIKY
ncbi:GNAT family N-acetyltransferase [Adhaeribacter radiodurans]|uniref:GNAT family N-acetyltransferase n=1 Tax=Adhaeribacter radiodurans TaxID=2745197 RepID=A0A7L7L3Y7_9BACT|nr:GNAT family N-acetyltransferase [Adhaeribacter radiodurans]QMU27517.1 GNAT family N-acetyltransferase [Adhaeribacter radiodurans]